MEALNYKDISLNILQFLRDGTTYKTATQVCRLWHTICREDLRWMIAKYSNHLWTLINKYPDTKWYWHGIWYNPNTTWEIICMSLTATNSKISSERSRYWDDISANHNITWEIISENPDNPWNWRAISYNPN